MPARGPGGVEGLGAIIGIALVTQPDGFETGPETREHLNLIADFVRTLVAHPELIADALEQLRETGEAVGVRGWLLRGETRNEATDRE